MVNDKCFQHNYKFLIINIPEAIRQSSNGKECCSDCASMRKFQRFVDLCTNVFVTFSKNIGTIEHKSAKSFHKCFA